MGDDAANTQAAPAAKMAEALRTIKAVCPECRRKYRLDERYAGRSLKCRRCGEKIDVPRVIELVRRPEELPPSSFVLILRRLRTFASGQDGNTLLRRAKWLTDGQSRRTRRAAIAVLALFAVIAAWLYLQSDSAKITFGFEAGKEVAFRRLVELEEELAATLAAVRSDRDGRVAAADVRQITERQAELWETLADWKQDGFLAPGESNLLRTRYRARFAAAQRRVSAERRRIGKITEANQEVTKAFRSHRESLATAMRLTLDGGRF